MSKKMLINATHLEENRVAIVEDGILIELDIEIAGKEQTKGNIYKGIVVRVETGLQAAFIDYGGERLGFLQMGEIHPSVYKAAEKGGENRGRPRINDVLRRGQELLVQIVKEERGTKGAALTTFLSLPGRYMVLMPDSDTKGVSRKIEEESQRKKLKEAMASLDLPPNMGYIVRTAGIGQKKEELKRDFDYLVRLYQNIQTLGKEARAPALIYKESNLVIRSIRDYFSSEMDEVLVDDPRVFQEARDFFQQVMPEYARLVKLHQERRPIFARYQIEEQIETISKNKVPLPSGGSIVIDQTEALVAVDVNSGKMATEQGVEATAYKTNLEAAAEAGRQLRLRDLGGLIVIDFIDMRDRKHIREVEKCLKDALKNDKARVTVGRISQFGLLEMSRQRIKAALAEGAYLTCPHCFGSGKIKSPEAQAVAFMRKIQAGVAKGQIGLVEGEVPLDVAIYLLNSKREELHEMERQRNLSIFIKGHPHFVAGQAELTFHKREQEKAEPEFVSAATTPPMPAVEPAQQEEVPLPVPEASTTEETPAEGEVKKKRRRRRKKKKGEREGEVVAEEVASPAEEPVAAAAEEAAVAGEVSEEKTKPKRRRSRRKKTATTEVPSTGAETQAAEGAIVAEERPAAEPPSRELEAAPAAERETAPAVEQVTPSPEEGKPKRRRTRKKTPEPAGEVADAEASASQGEQGEEPPKPEEKGRTAVRKAESKPAEALPEASEPPVERAEENAGVDKPKAARKPRTRVRKAAASETPPAAGEEPRVAVATDPADPAKKPKKRPPRKKAPAGEGAKSETTTE
jgi:ribonuclease E